MDYFRGSMLQIDATFTDINGALIDPTTVYAEFKGTDGTVHSTSPSRQSLGKFRWFLDTSVLAAGQRWCTHKTWSPPGDPAQAVTGGVFGLLEPD